MSQNEEACEPVTVAIFAGGGCLCKKADCKLALRLHFDGSSFSNFLLVVFKNKCKMCWECNILK